MAMKDLDTESYDKLYYSTLETGTPFFPPKRRKIHREESVTFIGHAVVPSSRKTGPRPKKIIAPWRTKVKNNGK